MKEAQEAGQSAKGQAAAPAPSLEGNQLPASWKGACLPISTVVYIRSLRRRQPISLALPVILQQDIHGDSVLKINSNWKESKHIIEL